MGSAERRAREKAGTREMILAAARELFVREGAAAVTMRRIADAIEYTAPALYSHFKDKHTLMRALCESDFGMLRESMRGLERIADPVERVRALGRAYIDFALDHPHHYRFMFMMSWPQEIEQPPPDEECGCGNPDHDAYAFLRESIRACIEAGRLRAEFRDPHLATQACWGAAHGVVSLFITHGQDPWVDFQSPRECAYLLIDGFVTGMVAPPDATAKTRTSRRAAAKPALKARKGRA